MSFYYKASRGKATFPCSLILRFLTESNTNQTKVSDTEKQKQKRISASHLSIDTIRNIEYHSLWKQAVHLFDRRHLVVMLGNRDVCQSCRSEACKRR